jgi:dienelactone hydrolase
MRQSKMSIGLMLAVCIVALLIGWHYFSGTTIDVSGEEWSVTGEGILNYQIAVPSYNISPASFEANSTISPVWFDSRGARIEALLRIPGIKTDTNGSGICVPGIVLLPGAAVSKEGEQKLAEHLADLGYASITLDQRNLGGIDPQGDLQMFLKGEEPTEHKMVYDALAAAGVMRLQPQIDPECIIYAGESNGGRFAIMACALDPAARGVLAISTCGYGSGLAIASSASAMDKDTARFYRSIDPESYLNMISPRPLIMIHSRNDTVISYQLAEQTYRLGLQPKRFYAVGCAKHGYCPEMDEAIKEELARMSVRNGEQKIIE